MSESNCLFCKIGSGEIPARRIYETDDVVAFRDINPQAPTHALVIPKRHIPSINDLTDGDAEIVGRLFLAARQIAENEGFSEPGYRVTMNCNAAAGQTVFHIHLHLLGGRDFGWPPG
ncbi:MAG: histidine triad nucleotide-binding protein [Gammaproteobacteria bacterium]|nr:histidine triad nucleotide-binding protein [Gammaproteobacteria bacterium]